MSALVAVCALNDRARADSLRAHVAFETVDVGVVVNAIAQDRDGLWWIASQSGLVKYNGYDAHHYTASPDSIAGNFVVSVFEDSAGVMWIGSTSGLSTYDKATDRFTHHMHDPVDPATISHDTIPMYHSQAIAEDRAGRIWIGTADGLSSFDRQTRRFTRYRSDPTDPSQLLDPRIGALLVTRDGALWIGTRDGLHRFDPDRGVVTERYRSGDDAPGALRGPSIIALHEDRAGDLWIGTRDAGLSKLDRATRTFSRYGPPDGPRGRLVTSIVEDARGVLWITTFGDGLSRFDPKTGAFVHHEYDPDVVTPGGISSKDLMQARVSHTGDVWIASLDGKIDIHRSSEPTLRIYRHVQGFTGGVSKGPYFGQMVEDRAGNLWVPVASAGLDRYHRETDTFSHYRHVPGDPTTLPEPYAQSVFEDREGLLWVTSRSWLTLFDRDAGRVIENYPIGQFAHAPLQDVADRDVLWFGSAGSGLIKFNKRTGDTRHFQPDPAAPATTLSDNMSFSVVQDDDGRLWVATLGGGLDRFDPSTETVTAKYKHDPDDPTTISSNTLFAIYRDRAGRYWVGSDAGLDRFDPDAGTFRRFSQRDGSLPTAAAHQIIDDGAGALWIATMGGVVRFDPNTETSRLFPIRGMTGTACRAVRTKRGELWLHGGPTLVRLDPAALGPARYDAPVVFTSITQRGAAMNLGVAAEQATQIRLSWRDNFFEFEVAALDYRRRGDTRYRYILDGWDDGWYDNDTSRRGRYVALDGGLYKLRVMAASSDGAWSEHVAELDVIVEAAPWDRWWARALYVALGLIAVAGYVRYRTGELREQVIEARKLGRYTLVEKIGEGGMGQVYRAEHAMLRRPTAIKLLPQDNVTDEQMKRFEREVQLTSELTHPNIITIYDYGRSATGVFYCAMEYLDGLDLGTLVERFGPQPVPRVIAILRQACSALSEAHERGLVHRDIKPGNMFLCQHGGVDVVKVLDFGLVKELDRGDDSVTRTDAILGTPAYLSPEAMTAPDQVGPAADLYGLGAVAYYLVTGTYVFTGATVAELCVHHLNTAPEPFAARMNPPLDHPVADQLEAIVLRCLAKQPDERFASAGELGRALASLAERADWSQADAEAWWRAMAAADASGRERVDTSDAFAQTVEIDLHARQ